jgi:3-hydroxyisobutyrate dehydrogenase
VEFLEVSVTGGQKGAVEGILTIMVGGREETFVFKAFGKNVIHVGPMGYGQAMKRVNQVVLALNTVAMAEGLRLAKALGLDMEKVAQVLSLGSARSGSIELYLPKLLQGDLSPGFKAAHLKKDLTYAMGRRTGGTYSYQPHRLLWSCVRRWRRRASGSRGSTRWVRCISN